MKRVHSHIERPPPTASERRGRMAGRVRLVGRLAGDLALSLGALAVAKAKGCPGIAMHARSALLIAKAAARGPIGDLPRALPVLASPLDSVRYFEFDFAWRQAAAAGRPRQTSSACRA